MKRGMCLGMERSTGIFVMYCQTRCRDLSRRTDLIEEETDLTEEETDLTEEETDLMEEEMDLMEEETDLTKTGLALRVSLQERLQVVLIIRLAEMTLSLISPIHMTGLIPPRMSLSGLTAPRMGWIG